MWVKSKKEENRVFQLAGQRGGDRLFFSIKFNMLISLRKLSSSIIFDLPFGLVAARMVHLVFSLQTIPALATEIDCCSMAS